MGSGFSTMNKVLDVTRNKTIFTEYDANTVYYYINFGAPCTKVYVVNDSESYDCQISWNGVRLDGQIKPGEDITLYADDATGIYVRVTNATGTNNIRVFAA